MAPFAGPIAALRHDSRPDRDDLRELITTLGHSTPGAALIYQRAAADGDQQIAEALSKLAEGGQA